MLTLTPQALADLRYCYHTTTDANLRTHCQIILLAAAGYRPPHIAAITLFSEASVRYYFDRYSAAGLAGLYQGEPGPAAVRAAFSEELTFYRLSR